MEVVAKLPDARPSVAVVDDALAARALLKPLRQRMLRCLEAPDSSAGLARRLGLPRQRLNYHLRELERAGLVELVEERGSGACAERLYRARAETFLIGPDATGEVAPASEAPREARLRDRFSWAHLVACLGRALRDLTVLRRRADEAQESLLTTSLETELRFRSAAELGAFSRRLTEAVAELVAEYHQPEAPGSRAYQLLLGCYPTVTEASQSPPNGQRSEA